MLGHSVVGRDGVGLLSEGCSWWFRGLGPKSTWTIDGKHGLDNVG